MRTRRKLKTYFASRETITRSRISRAVYIVPSREYTEGAELFDAILRQDGHEQLLGTLQFTADQQTPFAGTLIELLNSSRPAVPFPRTNLRYLSLPVSLAYYHALLQAVGPADSRAVLYATHDLPLLQHSRETDVSLVGHCIDRLTDGSSRRYIRDAAVATIFSDPTYVSSRRFSLQLALAHTTGSARIDLDFRPDTFPGDIHVFVGQNGAGKTQALYAIAAALSRGSRGQVSRAQFEPSPRFSRSVFISLSPYDEYPGPFAETFSEASDQLYFGLRDSRGRSSLPAAHRRAYWALKWLLKDEAIVYQTEREKKQVALFGILGMAVQFDGLAIFDKDGKMMTLFEQGRLLSGSSAKYKRGDPKRGIALLSRGSPLHLSAGQQSIVFAMLFLVASLRDDSIALIDEPELFLHPSLEVSFMRVIRDLLTFFNSVAIIATHSPFILREVERSHVHIFSLIEGALIIDEPRRQTFGANTTTIVRDVFEDFPEDAASRQWIREKGEKFSSFEELLESGIDLNAESLAYLRNTAFRNKP
jgi:predicted ATPase